MGLQRVVESGKLGSDAAARREWASLLTVQWAIRRHVQMSSRDRRMHNDCGAVGLGDDATERSSTGRSGGDVPSQAQVEVSG